MCKTVKVYVPSALPAWMALVLVLLVSLLAVHFLFEDLSFLLNQPGEISATLISDELTHQDDLALSTSLLPQIMPARMKPALAQFLPAQTQTLFPHFKPPKI